LSIDVSGTTTDLNLISIGVAADKQGMCSSSATECYPPYGITFSHRLGWTRFGIASSRQSGTWFPGPRGLEGCIDFGGQLYTTMVYLSKASHPSKQPI